MDWNEAVPPPSPYMDQLIKKIEVLLSQLKPILPDDQIQVERFKAILGVDHILSNSLGIIFVFRFSIYLCFSFLDSKLWIRKAFRSQGERGRGAAFDGV